MNKINSPNCQLALKSVAHGEANSPLLLLTTITANSSSKDSDRDKERYPLCLSFQ